MSSHWDAVAHRLASAGALGRTSRAGKIAYSPSFTHPPTAGAGSLGPAHRSVASRHRWHPMQPALAGSAQVARKSDTQALKLRVASEAG